MTSASFELPSSPLRLSGHDAPQECEALGVPLQTRGANATELLDYQSDGFENEPVASVRVSGNWDAARAPALMCL